MAEKTPDLANLSTMWYSESLTGDRTQVAYVTEVPPLEEAPDPVTATVLDLDYELSQPGIRKASTIEIPVLFTHTQHNRLQALDKDTEYYWFFVSPDATAETSGSPLVQYFTGKIRITLDTMTPDEFMQDTITLYKTSEKLESDGFPTA